MTPLSAPLGWASRVRPPDVIAILAVCLLGSLVLLPAIHQSRVSAHIRTCQDNLHRLGLALGSYSHRHHDFFPTIPVQGKLAAAGIYAPTLLHTGFLTEARVLVCPSSPLSQRHGFRVPSLDEVQSAADEDLVRLQGDMGGSYGYSLGYVQDGVYHGTKNLGRPYFAVAADAPNAKRADHQAPTTAAAARTCCSRTAGCAFR